MSVQAALPLDPLRKLAELKADLHAEDGRGGFTERLFAEMLGTTAMSLNRWSKTGMVPWASADECAVALGLHPALVWGDLWWNVKGDFDKLAAAAERDLARYEVDERTAEATENA
jgi:hypothetical protein